MSRNYGVRQLWVIIDKALREQDLTAEEKRVLGILAQERMEVKDRVFTAVPQVPELHDMEVHGFEAGSFIRFCRCGAKWPCPQWTAEQEKPAS